MRASGTCVRWTTINELHRWGRAVTKWLSLWRYGMWDGLAWTLGAGASLPSGWWPFGWRKDPQTSAFRGGNMGGWKLCTQWNWENPVAELIRASWAYSTHTRQESMKRGHDRSSSGGQSLDKNRKTGWGRPPTACRTLTKKQMTKARIRHNIQGEAVEGKTCCSSSWAVSLGEGSFGRAMHLAETVRL